MNYNLKEDPHGQKPVGGYIIQVGGNPYPQPDPAQQQLAMSPDMVKARTREAFAQSRQEEAKLTLMYMHEIRAALNMQSLTVSDGDTGSKDRPPMEPAFRGDVRDKLQQCYLRLAERTINHTENFLRKELNVDLTNEIKLAPNE